MIEKLELKVGDRVRLTGLEWSNDSSYPAETGDIVTVESVDETGSAWSRDAQSLTLGGGYLYTGYAIEKVKGTPTEVPEVREVNLDTVVNDVRHLISQMIAMGFDPEYAKLTTFGYLEGAVGD